VIKNCAELKGERFFLQVCDVNTVSILKQDKHLARKIMTKTCFKSFAKLINYEKPHATIIFIAY